MKAVHLVLPIGNCVPFGRGVDLDYEERAFDFSATTYNVIFPSSPELRFKEISTKIGEPVITKDGTVNGTELVSTSTGTEAVYCRYRASE